MERPGAVTFNGNSVTLIGPELRVGQPAPDFVVLTKDLREFTLKDTKPGVRVFSAVPSIDTPVCDTETRRFNKEAGSLDGVTVYTVSMDLPFAQARWCAAAGIDRVVMLSDYRDAAFGMNYGTLIKQLRLECRAVFVVDSGGMLTYVEYVPEITNHPNYDAVLRAIRSLS
ncbi:MAG TPA: thiol peroxidase [Acidobacteriota bacterium]|nr:thiol peroxidase [Acidobacteriota bacterium]